MAGAYRVNANGIFTAMAALDNAPADTLVTISDLANPATNSGRQVKMMQITGPGDSSSRDVAMIIGGQHSRELAPPDAVFSFAKNLVDAYRGGTDIDYRAFTVGGTGYSVWKIPKADVRRIIDNLVILVVPVVNPDGRDHVLAAAANKDWRGNRNLVACPGFGVDLNRNYNIAWDPNTLVAPDRAYYSTTDLAQIVGDGGFDPNCSSVAYHGPAEGSESETKNIQTVIDTRKVSYFMDVHSSGRWILYPWGIAGTQTTDSGKNFLEPSHDRTVAGGGGRTVTDGTYEEYVPNRAPLRILETHRQIAAAIRREIEDQAGAGSTARSRSRYRIEPIVNIYKILRALPRIVPVPGSSTDYAFSRQFKPGETKPAYSFALECGSRLDGEGGFRPSIAVYEKVEREVHAGLIALLKAGVAGPAPTVGGGGSSGGASASTCDMVLATMSTPIFTLVQSIRFIRDDEMARLPFHRPLGALDRWYRRFSARTSRSVARSTVLRGLIRYLVVPPVYALAQLTRLAGRMWRRIRARIGRGGLLVLLIAMAVLDA